MTRISDRSLRRAMRGPVLWRLISGGIVLSWRFVTGRPMDGRVRTDTRFLHRAGRVLTPTGHASRWAMLPGWQRAAWRLGALTVLLATGAGLLMERRATMLAWSVALAAAAGWGAYRAYLYVTHFWHNRLVVRPLMATLVPALGMSPHTARGRIQVDIPRDYADADDPDPTVVVRLPFEFNGNAQARIAVKDLIQRKLGLDWTPHWEEIGRPVCTFTLTPTPPKRVTFAELRQAFETGAPSRLILGKNTSGGLVTVDLDAEAPHIALSMGTGGGKSSTLRLIVCYLLRHGVERVIILDPKRLSLKPFEGIPGVEIYKPGPGGDCSAWTQAIAAFRAEMESRYTALEENDEFKFPRWVLIIEEMNSLTEAIAEDWAERRTKDDPKKAPALRDLGFILFQGRQACMNVVAVLQQANAAAMGGSALRDQFGCKILARYSMQTWNMLVGTNPRPRSSKHPGRAVMTFGDEWEHIQQGFISEKESREYALECRAGLTGLPPLVPAALTSQRHAASIEQGIPGVTVTDVPDDRIITATDAPTAQEARFSLAEAARLKIVPVSYDVLRQAKHRDSNFPEGVDMYGDQMYSARELIIWYNERPSTRERLPVPV